MLEEHVKICMPVLDENGLNSVVYGHFGSAPFFAVYDTDTKNVVFANNNESGHEHGKCMPVDAIRALNAEAVLCKGMGMRAANLLIAAGIKPFLVDAGTIADAIGKYDAREVRALDESTSCQAHGCH
jgi:predicted Fe-Mo cluster-binding NifX family protein